MDKSAFFTRTPQTKQVDVPDFGAVTIRKLTQREVEVARREYGTPDKALEGLRYVVSRAVVDETGTRVFDDADQAKLADVDFDVVNAIAGAITTYSGLTDPKADRTPAA